MKARSQIMDYRSQIIKALLLALGLSLIAISAHALDYPHTFFPSGVNTVDCQDCHYIHGGAPWETVPLNIDETYNNNLCLGQCHNDVIANHAEPHSSLTVSGSYWAGQGGWSIGCYDCHDTHSHNQPDAYGSSSYLDSGDSDLIANLNEITKTGAGWDDTGSGEFAGMMVIPDTTDPFYVYQIISNTTDTLTVRGPMVQRWGDPLLTIGNSYNFAIFYGGLVRSTIKVPDIATCEVVANEFICVAENYTPTPVKFFRKTGDNSFADADTTYDGICEVCHTQTDKHKNDGTGASHNDGLKCTDCHNHAEGFKGGGCNSCHAYPPHPGDGNIYQGVEGKGAHQVHVEYISQLVYGQSYTLQLDPDNDTFGTGSPGVICGTCHTNTSGNHIAGERIIDFSNDPLNGVTLEFEDASTNIYNGTSGSDHNVTLKTCSNVSCHYQTTPQWEPW